MLSYSYKHGKTRHPSLFQVNLKPKKGVVVPEGVELVRGRTMKRSSWGTISQTLGKSCQLDSTLKILLRMLFIDHHRQPEVFISERE